MAEKKPSRLLRAREVVKRVSFCKKTLLRWEKEGNFPRRIHAGHAITCWLESDIEAWIMDRAKNHRVGGGGA